MTKQTKKYKVKGIRYITEKLQKYYPARYKDKKVASARARELNNIIKGAKGKVNLKSVRAIETKHRVKKEIPELSEFLLTPQPYFELVSSYQREIIGTRNIIDFSSNLFEGTIKGGDIVDYYEYFEPFVSFANQVRETFDPADQKSDTAWLVVCTPLEEDKKTGRWKTEILIVDDNGRKIEEDYGFKKGRENTTRDYIIPSEEDQEKAKKVEPKEEPTPPSTTKDDKGFEIELLKAKEKADIAEAAKIKEQREYIKDLKELGYTNEEIRKKLG